jgi:hypothetical protein
LRRTAFRSSAATLFHFASMAGLLLRDLLHGRI